MKFAFPMMWHDLFPITDSGLHEFLLHSCWERFLIILCWYRFILHLVSEAIFVITSALKDVCGKPPTERLFLDKYGKICLCLDEIVWKVRTSIHDIQFVFTINKVEFCLCNCCAFLFEGSVGEHRQRSNQETYTVETTNWLLSNRQLALPCQVHTHELFRLLCGEVLVVWLSSFSSFLFDSITMLLILNPHIITLYQNFSFVEEEIFLIWPGSSIVNNLR